MSEYTYANPPARGTQERRNWQADNCEKLATIMEDLPQELHKQGLWIDECGTAGCALGWAAMSGEFDGLQYASDNRWVDHAWKPVINGGYGYWGQAGTTFFGEEANTKIFSIPTTPRSVIIQKLRRMAVKLRAGRAS